MDTKTPLRSGRNAPSRRLSPWWLFLLIVVSVPALVLAVSQREPTRSLSYGQFKRALVAGEVRSVKVGVDRISGLLESSDPRVPSTPFYAYRTGMEHDAELASLLAKHLPNGDYDADPGAAWVVSLLIPLLILALLGSSLFLVARRNGLGSAMAFTRSRHQLYDRKGPGVTFDDVAGSDEAVAELREVVDFLKTPEKFRRLGARIPKGVLLSGPPGTGKTLLAKAVAGESGVPFYSLSGSDFVEMFVGVGAARVRNLFTQAKAKAPCLIFIDEIDALGKSRGGGGPGNHDERDQTLNQLLVELDGFDSGLGIIVVAATNRPETLDSALVRPGRFDRNIGVDRPDIHGREQILKVHVRSVALEDSLNLRQIAAMTAGFVGADLSNLVNEATLLAARRGKDKVGRAEFEEGVERVIAGPEKKQRVLRRDEQLRIAYHEAGHALVARSLPGTDPVHKISIVGRGRGALGYTMYRPEDDQFLHTQSWLENSIRTLLGGTLAEELVYGEVSDGATSDLQRATAIARKMVTEFGMSPTLGRVSYCTESRSPFAVGNGMGGESWSERTAHAIDQEVRRILNEAQVSTRALLASRRPALEAITDALMEKECIDAADLDRILAPFPMESTTLSA